MFIYVISAEINDKKSYKIGYTRRSVNERIKEFKTGNASEFKVEWTFESNWSTKLEAYLHKQFKSKKINGEWFDLNDNDLSDLKRRCLTMHNNLEIMKEQNMWFIDRGYKLY